MSPGDEYHDTAGHRKVLAGPSSSCEAPWQRNSSHKSPTKPETIKPISSSYSMKYHLECNHSNSESRTD